MPSSWLVTDVVPFQRPSLPSIGRIERYYRMAERDHWYSNNGPCARLLRERLEAYVGGGLGCVLVSSGTMALLVALRAALGEPGARRELLVPSYTFIATVSAIRWAGFEPVFVDVDRDHWHLDPACLEQALEERREQVAGVLAASTFGCAPPLTVRTRWERACAELEVPLIVDSAAGFGSRDEAGAPLAAQGDAEAFSFHATKPFAVGEGGAVFAADPELVERMIRQAAFGLDERRVLVDEPGLNAKMSELHAAAGLAALDEHERVLAARRERAARLRVLLEPTGVSFQHGSERSAWQFVPVLAPTAAARDAALREGAARGVGLRSYHEPLHEMERLRGCAVAGTLDATREIASRSLSLPLSNDIGDDELARVAEVVAAAVVVAS